MAITLRIALALAFAPVGAAMNETELASTLADAKTASVTNFIDFKLDPAVGKAGLESQAEFVAKELGCATPTRVFPPAGKHEAKHMEYGLHLWYKTDCGSSIQTVASLSNFVDRVTTHDDSAAATATLAVTELAPEFEVHEVATTSNDPLLQFQDHYDAIKLFDAWDIERGSGDVVVQVLDSGVDMRHQDLQLNIWDNPGEYCYNGIDDDGNGYVDDCHGYNHADGTGADLLGSSDHGSHCAGTVSADTDNGIGLAGVAGGTPSEPGVKLMISLGFGDTRSSGFAAALIYGADNGARISSNSWGYVTPGYFDQAVRAAIDYATDEGVLVVFAAGNDNANVAKYPAYYYKTVAVAATYDSGVRAYFSNYGSWVDVSAPGYNVASTSYANSYVYKSGTSMACPHISGVLALGVSASPAATNAFLLNCLYTTAANIDGLNPGFVGLLGAGLVDAKAFLDCVIAAAQTPSPTPRPTPSPTPRPTPSPTPSPTPRPTPSPTPSPTPRPTTTGCQDDPSWYKKNKPTRTCAWMSNKIENNWSDNKSSIKCKKWKNPDGIRARDACCACAPYA